jgi:hypothetical protein
MTGGFPVEYGNRMSGVVDISPATPREPLSTAVSLSFTNFGILNQGLFKDGHGQWLVSARHTYLDAVMKWVDPESGFKPTFNDLLFHLQLPMGERSVLGANLLGARDDLYYESWSDDGNLLEEQIEADQSSGYLWLNLKTAWSGRLYSETVLSSGQVEHGREGEIDTYWYDATVDDQRSFDFVGLKQDWTLELGRHLAKWGFDVRRLDGSYDYASWAIERDPLYNQGQPPLTTVRDIDLEPSGNQYGLYVADRFQVASRLVAEVGLRWDKQTYVGDDQLSPRLNISYLLGSRTTVRAAWGFYHQPQYINELQVEDGVSEFAPAQRAEHRLIGLEHSFPRFFDLRLELYHKDLTDLRPRYENQLNPMEVLPEIEPDRILVAPDRAVARGAEVLLSRSDSGPCSWWLSYAWSEAEDEIDGQWVPRSWDQTHTIAASLNYNRRGKWNFNLSGIYHTGWPTTAIEAEVRFTDDGTRYVVAWLGPRNAERYPDYKRFDLRASRTFELGAGSLRLFLEVINLLDNETLGRLDSVGFRIQPDGSLVVTEDWEYVMPILPTVGLRWVF